MTLVEDIVVKRLGRAEYLPTWQAMRAFTQQRNESTPDELWLLEHPPVYTLGQGAPVPEASNAIPVARSDRGGDITYHGPGQAVIYTLVDLARRSIKVKRYVWLLEQCVIDLIGGLFEMCPIGYIGKPLRPAYTAERKPGAPGVYVGGAKIAALGIRVFRGRAYHGLALNVDMDLSPFGAIDPCGYPGLRVTQMRDLGLDFSVPETADRFAGLLIEKLNDA